MIIISWLLRVSVLTGGVLVVGSCHERQGQDAESNKPLTQDKDSSPRLAAGRQVSDPRPPVPPSSKDAVDTSPAAIAIIMGERYGEDYVRADRKFAELLETIRPVGKSRAEIIRILGRPDRENDYGQESVVYRFHGGYGGYAWYFAIKDGLVSSYSRNSIH